MGVNDPVREALERAIGMLEEVADDDCRALEKQYGYPIEGGRAETCRLIALSAREALAAHPDDTIRVPMTRAQRDALRYPPIKGAFARAADELVAAYDAALPVEES
jgi:hypothetical protein